ncbi:hypothetical protein [uncultured Lentibacter sp.]|uniref:hypothetical protein n=1 Tax=uncultured Lentibacter sp. TaxID=1659309 RepID=UPI00260EBA6B|nr:hypothetical protein [uncultured Lentibacter sp.]MCW1954588.1 hypothetical protein [Roseobacter sp.]
MKNQTASHLHAKDSSSFKPERPQDKILWSPLEALLFCGANVAVFAFLMGRGHYAYIAHLFEPVFAIGLFVVCAQWAYQTWQRKRSPHDQP